MLIGAVMDVSSVLCMPAGSSGTVTFPNLDKGTYMLHVVAWDGEAKERAVASRKVTVTE